MPGAKAPDAAEVQGRPPKEPTADAADTELLSWKVWLFPKRPMISTLVVSVVFVCLFLAYRAVPQLLFVAVLGLIFINRLAPYLFPVTFYIREVTVGYRTFLAKDQKRWDRFFCYSVFPDGVLLSHDTSGLRGRIREGLFLYFDKELASKDEIVAQVRARLPSAKEAHESKGTTEKKAGVSYAWQRAKRARRQKDDEE